jgi:hypothetical protein
MAAVNLYAGLGRRAYPYHTTTKKQIEEQTVTLNRRDFLSLLSAGVVASMWADNSIAATAGRVPIRAVVFDAFPIFDPRPVLARAAAHRRRFQRRE